MSIFDRARKSIIQKIDLKEKLRNSLRFTNQDIKITYKSFHKIIASDIDKKLKRLTLIVERNIIAKTKNYRRKNISASFLIRMRLNNGIIDITPLPTELEKYKYTNSEHDNLIFGRKLYPSIYEITTIQLLPRKD